jgi:hypothetical protein
VLSDTGYRLGEDAKALLRAVRDKAARGRAAQAQADVAAHMDFGRLGGALVRLLGRRMMKEPADPSDYIATLDADLAHDATDALPKINAPTLVIAGTRDFFVPEPILRATAERIPDATLRLYDGVGHAVGKTHKRRFEDDVLARRAFLAARVKEAEDISIADQATEEYLDKQFKAIRGRVDRAVQRIGGRANTVYNDNDEDFRGLVMAKEVAAQAKAAKEATQNTVDELVSVRRRLGIH